MTETSASLLERARDPADASAWKRFDELYRPLIDRWLRSHGVQPADADDLTQEIMAVVLRELPAFRYDPTRSFRGWLRTVTANRMRAFWKQRQSRPRSAGDADLAPLIDQLEDPDSTLSRRWDHEHEQYVARSLLTMIREEFEPVTWKAFQAAAIDGRRAADVAAELNISENAVYIAKSRVMRRLREEMQGLSN